MANEVQRIELAHGRFDAAMGGLTLVLWAGALYYTMDPEGFQRNLDKLRSAWGRVQHRVSVWEAVSAIRSLPTTDITGITDAETR